MLVLSKFYFPACCVLCIFYSIFFDDCILIIEYLKMNEIKKCLSILVA